jgi:deazaflavin-dependent oxidoreductase (nitroreductase family)
MRLPTPMIDAGAWMLENGHRALLRLSGGRLGKKVMGMQAVELFHTGRKSGLPRNTILTAPIIEDDRVVLIASKGGHPEHPDWYRNITATPEVELAIGVGNDQGPRRPMRARTASPEEKADLWPRVVAVYKGYEGYQRSTDRDIPVVLLEPRSSV